MSTRLNNNSNKNKNFKAQENLVGRQKRSKTLKKITVTQIQVICLTHLLPRVLTFYGAIFNTVCIAKLYYTFVWAVAIPPQSFVHMI